MIWFSSCIKTWWSGGLCLNTPIIIQSNLWFGAWTPVTVCYNSIKWIRIEQPNICQFLNWIHSQVNETCCIICKPIFMVFNGKINSRYLLSSAYYVHTLEYNCGPRIPQESISLTPAGPRSICINLIQEPYDCTHSASTEWHLNPSDWTGRGLALHAEAQSSHSNSIAAYCICPWTTPCIAFEYFALQEI